MKNILITGGAGFIGSHVVRLFVNKYPEYQIFNLDTPTYAGNLENLKDVENVKNYTFLKTDMNNSEDINLLFATYKFDKVIHLTAESHVDRSIADPFAFVRTNVIGTVNLLIASKDFWKDDFTDKLFYYLSKDQVYGILGETGLFTETTSYDPNSPYSASKASSDHFVRAYGETYKLPFIISNCSNNYGPNQFLEKLIPLFIHNIVWGKSLPVYGDGKYTRDWLYVVDHAVAVDLAFHQGQTGETYNSGGFNESQIIDLIKLLCELMVKKLGRETGSSIKLITYIKDCPGHDKRYAIDATIINKELGWKPSVSFEKGLSKTVDWYLEYETWLNNVTSGKCQEYYDIQYTN